MPRVILVALVVFATIYALVDCLQTDGRRMRIMPKPVWLLVCLVPVLGPIMWLVAGKPTRRAVGPGPAPRGTLRGARCHRRALVGPMTTPTSCASSQTEAGRLTPRPARTHGHARPVDRRCSPPHPARRHLPDPHRLRRRLPDGSHRLGLRRPRASSLSPSRSG